MGLDLERKGQCENVPSSLKQALYRSRIVDSGRNSLLASASFPRIPSAGSGVSGV